MRKFLIENPNPVQHTTTNFEIANDNGVEEFSVTTAKVDNPRNCVTAINN